MGRAGAGAPGRRRERPPEQPRAGRAPPAADTGCWGLASIPQVRGLHLRCSARLFTAEVRRVIAGMENSFLSLAFIYTLIKEPFTDGGMAASGCGARLAPGQAAGGGGGGAERGARGDKGAREGRRREREPGRSDHPARAPCPCGWTSPRS